jgi:hypothetical protein
MYQLLFYLNRYMSRKTDPRMEKKRRDGKKNILHTKIKQKIFAALLLLAQDSIEADKRAKMGQKEKKKTK